MEIKELISAVAILLVFVGYTPYIIDTIQGKTRPHMFTFLLSSIINAVLFFLQLYSNGGPGSWVTFCIALICFFLFILSLKNGSKDIKKNDYVFLLLAIVTIAIWLIARQPLLSSILLTTIGVLAFIPTIRKSWTDPWSETLSMYLITFLRHGLAVIALTEINFITALFPAFWVLINLLFSIMLIVRRKAILKA